MKLCKLCGRTLHLSAFSLGSGGRRNKDCKKCRKIESERPKRGESDHEKYWHGRQRYLELRAEARKREKAGQGQWEVDHIVPVRSKMMNPDCVLICGLEVPDNLELVPKGENRSKWMIFTKSDAERECKRMMEIAARV